MIYEDDFHRECRSLINASSCHKEIIKILIVLSFGKESRQPKRQVSALLGEAGADFGGNG